ncbi:MAG: rRNA pseudouridine synthase [Oscillospiraceae bacterium]|nr:rRNA pseudouridine synthase [Oscillospiraceae bacterium]
MKERVQKIIAQRGICSRRKAEQWILEGRVLCNGAVVSLGDSADPETDEILLDGKPLPSGEAKVYLMLHKPRGYVTTLSDEKGRPNVSQLVADCGARVYPVGRLDMDSEGLLLFTNDGELANSLMHPSHEVKKTYHVWVNGYHTAAVSLLGRRIELDGYLIKAPQIKLLKAENDRAKLSVTIHEGRNRQVRRMCAAAGLSVHRLKRVSEGSLRLGELPLGKWRYLSQDEINLLHPNP